MLWLVGRKISFENHPDLEEALDDFIIALTYPNRYDKEVFEEKGPKWRAAQAVLSGTWNLLKIRLGNPFLDLSKFS